MSNEREFDIVLFGATGFVGVLTAEYLARSASDNLRVALAGRNRTKLETVRAQVGGRAEDWPLIVADSGDGAALAEMARRARVVITTVGPYRRYGLPVVEACANAGTDYVDLTGEVLFIREAIDRYHDTAKANGARIVNSCGFDSIPSDLGSLLLHEAAAADGAGDLEDTTLVVRAMRGGASGGTIASMKGMVDDFKADPSLAKLAADPYALSPDRAAEPDLGNEDDLRRPVYDSAVGSWLGPFVMETFNTRIVRRSNALQEWAYGRRFRYREAMAMGEGAAGRLKAWGLAGVVNTALPAMGFRPTRAVLDRVLPDPGEGPSEKARAKGHFAIDVHTRTSSGRRYVCHIAAQGDPGYAATAVMLSESALCLVNDRDQLPDRAGVLTPATAMGTALIDRLRKAGHTYDVEPV